MPKSTPVPVAMSLCDDLVVDSKTRKVHVIGWYDCIRATAFPHTHPIFLVVVPLAGAEGKYKFSVRCSGLAGSTVFASPEREFVFQSTHQVVWVSFRIRRVRFPRPGIYQVQHLCENRAVCDRSLTVLTKEGNGDV